jgi:hypothetical protein
MNEHLIKMIKSNSDKYFTIFILTAFYFLNNQSKSSKTETNKNFNDLTSDNYIEKCFDLNLRSERIISTKYDFRLELILR